MVLNYWIEGTSNVWVNVPTISANSTTSIIIKKTTGYSPNGYDTFPMFAGDGTNPFQVGSLNADGSIRITKDESYLTAPYAYIDYPDGTFNFLQYGYRTKLRMKSSDVYARPLTYFQEVTASGVDTLQDYYLSDYNNYIRGWDYNVGSAYFQYSYSFSHLTTYVTWEIEETPNNAKIYRAGTQIADLTISPSSSYFKTANRYTWRTHGSNSTFYIDIMFLFVSKYSPNHPSTTVTDLGGDEYQIDITNSSGTELTDYQISISGSELGTVTNDESLEVSEKQEDTTSCTFVSRTGLLKQLTATGWQTLDLKKYDGTTWNTAELIKRCE